MGCLKEGGGFHRFPPERVPQGTREKTKGSHLNSLRLPLVGSSRTSTVHFMEVPPWFTSSMDIRDGATRTREVQEGAAPARPVTAASAEAEIPASALRWILEGLRALGLDRDEGLGIAGLSLKSIDENPAGLVSRSAYAQLLNRVITQHPDFAVKAGRCCPFGTFPLLDCTTAACATLGEAIEALTRYSCLVTSNGRFQLAGNALELLPAPALPDWFRIASFEFGLHYTAARLDELVGGAAVRGIEVPWASPPWASAYPHPTRFGASRAAVLLQEGVLGAASRRADPLVASLLARNAAMVLSAMPSVPTLQARLHEAIVSFLPRGFPTMDTVARALATSPRTLRRRLAAEGLTFERVRDGALVAIARERLSDRRESIAEVAFVLGFSEVRAFHRAFRRWTGVTPGEYRRAALPELLSQGPSDP
jgi:AraC-like DNA-binding protein